MLAKYLFSLTSNKTRQYSLYCSVGKVHLNDIKGFPSKQALILKADNFTFAFKKLIRIRVVYFVAIYHLCN